MDRVCQIRRLIKRREPRYQFCRRHLEDCTMFDRTMPSLLPAGAGETVDVLGARTVYKATHADTGGQFSLFEQTVPPGYAAPLHRHADEDEAFYLLEGEITLEGEGGARRAGPGSFVFLPRGSFHAFHNDTASVARLLVICTPGAALERCFAGFDAAARRGELSPPALVAIAAGHGVEIIPPPSSPVA
jgi:quercetin dioxygenase-like cupin family protein